MLTTSTQHIDVLCKLVWLLILNVRLFVNCSRAFIASNVSSGSGSLSQFFSARPLGAFVADAPFAAAAGMRSPQPTLTPAQSVFRSWSGSKPPSASGVKDTDSLPRSGSIKAGDLITPARRTERSRSFGKPVCTLISPFSLGHLYSGYLFSLRFGVMAVLRIFF